MGYPQAIARDGENIGRKSHDANSFKSTRHFIRSSPADLPAATFFSRLIDYHYSEAHSCFQRRCAESEEFERNLEKFEIKP
jgi:hypothetical protein